jgi:dodecin
MKTDTSHAKHRGSLANMRVIELVGESYDSWDDAARRLVKREAAKHRNITGLDVLRSTAVVREGKIVEYRIDAKMAYEIDPERAEE